MNQVQRDNGSMPLLILQQKDELLIEAMVLIKQVNEAYQWPRLQGWIERYDAMMQSVMEQQALDELARRCAERNRRKGIC